MSEVTNEQIVDDLAELIGLHEERVARGAVHGTRDLAQSVLTMLSAAGRLIPVSELVVSSRDALAKAIRELEDSFAGINFDPLGNDDDARSLADALLESGVVQVVPTGKLLATDPDHETAFADREALIQWAENWAVEENLIDGAPEVVEALADALLASGVVRPLPDEWEYGVRTVPWNGSSDITPCADRQQADDFAKAWRDYARGYEADVIRRRPAGPWMEVPGE